MQTWCNAEIIDFFMKMFDFVKLSTTGERTASDIARNSRLFCYRAL